MTSFDTTVDTDYTQFLKDDASNKETWWTTTGRATFTTFNNDIATSHYDEALAINFLERDRDLAYNLTAQSLRLSK